MSRYGAGASRAGINTANSAYFQIRPTATTVRPRVVEIVVGIAVAPTTAPALYLSRSTAVGTSTATLAGQPYDPADPTSLLTFDSTWSTAPTFSTTNWLAVGALAVTAGGAWVWSFQVEPLVLAASTSAGLVIANANASGSTTGTFNCSVLWDE